MENQEIKLNYETYKERIKIYEKLLKKILRTLPREMLIEECKKRKIIQRDWLKKREKYEIAQKNK